MNGIRNTNGEHLTTYKHFSAKIEDKIKIGEMRCVRFYSF